MNESAADIRYLKRKEIDLIKWDQCIEQASNGLLYARSFYLDMLSKKWSALVWKDYEAVMPLTWNRKYGFRYLYQPPFTAQLGMFSKNKERGIDVEDFISSAKKHFRFCEIHLNYGNTPEHMIPRANFVLNLARPYAEIRHNYKKRLLENLAEAEIHSLEYLSTFDYASTIFHYQTAYGKRFPKVKMQDYQNFSRLCDALLKRKMLFVRQIKDDSNEWLSSSIFFTDYRRIYNIMSVTLPAGRGKRSHFYLLDQLIREFSEQQMLLDFEGSELPGVAEFYKKFGPAAAPYPFLKYNQLPFPFNLFK